MKSFPLQYERHRHGTETSLFNATRIILTYPGLRLFEANRPGEGEKWANSPPPWLEITRRKIDVRILQIKTQSLSPNRRKNAPPSIEVEPEQIESQKKCVLNSAWRPEDKIFKFIFSLFRLKRCERVIIFQIVVVSRFNIFIIYMYLCFRVSCQ